MVELSILIYVAPKFEGEMLWWIYWSSQALEIMYWKMLLDVYFVISFYLYLDTNNTKLYIDYVPSDLITKIDKISSKNHFLSKMPEGPNACSSWNFEVV